MARMSAGRGCGRTPRRFCGFPSRISAIQRSSVRLGSHQSKGCSTPARSAHSDELQSVVYEVEHDLGKIVIRNMDETDIDGGAVLLSRSFAGRQWQSLEERYATIPEDSAYLSNMCVDPKFRGCGVGKCMLHACDRVVMDIGQRNRVSLHANSDIAPFYANNGYERSSGARWPFIKHGPVVMTKLLPQSQ